MLTVTVNIESDSLFTKTQATISDSTSFDLSFTNPCVLENKTTLTSKSQSDPLSDDYSGNDVTFTYDPFTVEPTYCPLTVSCTSVVYQGTAITTGISCSEIDTNTNTLVSSFSGTDYQNGLAPGDYLYTFTVSTGGPGALTQTFTFTQTLEDPCDPPTVSAITLVDQTETVTDTEKVYAISPQITVDPDYCGLTITPQIPAALQGVLSFDPATQ